MAVISSQSTRTSGRAQNYAKKDAVAISAVGAQVPLFEQRLQQIREAHGKDGLRPKAELDEEGRQVRDADGDVVVQRDAKGRPVYEPKYVEAYSLIQSFGHDELDPSDPDSWTRANASNNSTALSPSTRVPPAAAPSPPGCPSRQEARCKGDPGPPRRRPSRRAHRTPRHARR